MDIIKNTNIIVTGGSGQVGKELRKILPNATYLSSTDYDLTDSQHIIRLFEELKPNTIIHLAARVGGIEDNIKYQTEYYVDNVLMNTLLLKYAVEYNVENFIGILSTCIYPDIVDSYPLREEMLHNGPPTSTNFTYGIAKRGMAVHIESINKQYNKKYCYITPCNLYGPEDKFNHRSHFVGALLKKIYEASKNGVGKIELFGTGTPLRQFMHARDLAGVLKLMVENNIYESFNLANNGNLSIKEIADLALKVTNNQHLKIEFDSSKPDGQYRKDVDLNKFRKLFPKFEFIELEKGLVEVYNSFTK